MKRCIGNLLLGWLLLASAFCHAASGGAIEQLTGLLAKMETFQSDFKQVSMDAKGVSVQEVSGTMSAMRPGLFYWKTDPPFEQLIVSDGEQLWLYDPDLEQVTVQPMDPRVAQTPALLLSGEVESLMVSYDVVEQQVEQLRVFDLQPKDPDSLFERLKLTFSGDRLVQMHLVDSLGQRSSVEFINPQTNIKLSAELFHFTPPPGVDVISQ